MESLRIHEEKIASGLAAYEAGIAAGHLTEADKVFLARVARLCAGLHFRLSKATAGRERQKAWKLCRRATGQDPNPHKYPDVERMKVDAPYLIECLTYACCEQRLRRTARRRYVPVAEVFDSVVPEVAAMMTTAMIAEVMNRVTTVREPREGMEAAAVADVWRVHTDAGNAFISLGEVLEARRGPPARCRSTTPAVSAS